MEPISQNIDKSFSAQGALKNDSFNKEVKNHRSTTVRDLELKLKRFLDFKKISRDSEKFVQKIL